MKLTKKKALEICAELWGWLKDTPSKEKYDWPRWTENGGDILFMSNRCPLCEYTNGDCKECPLVSFLSYCTSGGIYTKWCRAESLKTRKKYAKMIKDECLRRLK